MKTAALELGAHGVRVNAVLPSATDTLINDHTTGWSRAAGKPNATREDYLDAVHRRAAAEGCAQFRTDEYRFVELPGVSHWVVDDRPRDIVDAATRRIGL